MFFLNAILYWFKKNKRQIINMFLDFGGIITKARPGDQFVSIDGKRTYFDLGKFISFFKN